MSAGYSDTPLAKKLGIKPGMRVRLVDAPDDYVDFVSGLDDVSVLGRTQKPIDFAHVFATRERSLERALPPLHRALERHGMIWISWPKGSSSIASEINREDVRRIGLATGLVDVKVCAVDADWSGLKFVIRVADRS